MARNPWVISYSIPATTIQHLRPRHRADRWPQQWSGLSKRPSARFVQAIADIQLVGAAGQACNFILILAWNCYFHFREHLPFNLFPPGLFTLPKVTQRHEPRLKLESQPADNRHAVMLLHSIPNASDFPQVSSTASTLCCRATIFSYTPA